VARVLSDHRMDPPLEDRLRDLRAEVDRFEELCRQRASVSAMKRRERRRPRRGARARLEAARAWQPRPCSRWIFRYRRDALRAARVMTN
jgi:hypothetical protein